jgi:hypothetical protein
LVFKKGESGNPGGRLKAQEVVMRRMAGLSPRAVATLERLLGSENEQIQLSAATQILDRYMGKAKTQVTAEITHTVSAATAHLAALTAKPVPTLDLDANPKTLISLDNPAPPTKQVVKRSAISKAQAIEDATVIPDETQ